MAMFVNATITSQPTMGEYCAFSQINPMAMLLPYGPYDQIIEHSICGH